MKKFLVRLFFVLLAVAGVGFMYAKFALGVIGPEKAEGVAVSMYSFLDGNVAIGIDLDEDGKADIKAYTNSFLAADMMIQTCQFSEGTSDGILTEIHAFTPIRVQALRCVISNGTLWERMIPQYIVWRYGDNIEEDLETI